MDQLKKQFENAQHYIARIMGKIEQGVFLTEEDFSGTFAILDTLSREQKRCIEQILTEEERFCCGEADVSIQKVEELLNVRNQRRELEQRIEKLRQTVSEFLSIRSLEDTYREQLAAFQKQLAERDDSELLEMEQAGALEIYRKFVACVKMKDPAVADVEGLTKEFGYQLSFAVLGKKLILQEHSSQDGTSGTVEGHKNQKIEPVEGEPFCAKAITDAGIEPKQEVPAFETPAMREIAPPLTNPGELGSLNQERGNKQPKGSKSLLSLCSNNRTTYQYVKHIINILSSGSLLSPDAPFYSGSALDKTIYEKTLALLLKEGYLIRYTVDNLPGKIMYGVTDAGRDVFRKEAVRKHFNLHNRRYPAMHAGRMETAVDFIRRYEGHYWFSKTFAESPIYAVYFECAAASLIEVYEREGGPLVSLIIPAVILTDADPKEAPEELCDAIRKTVEKADGNLKVFLAAYTEEECAGWETYLCAQGLFLEETCILRGIIGEDAYYDTKGAPCSLSAYIQALIDRGLAESRQSADEAVYKAEAMADKSETLADDKPEGGKEPAAVLNPTGGTANEKLEKEDNPPSARFSSEAEQLPPALEKGSEQPASLYDTTERNSPVEIDIQNQTAQQNAQQLLNHPDQIRPDHLIQLMVQLMAENRLAEAAALAEILAKAPNASEMVKHFYRTFQQSIRFPGSTYHYSSEVIVKQQRALTEEDAPLRTLQQVMVLSTLLWAMAFPSASYDHNLYNNAKMVVSGELEDYLTDEIQPIQDLIILLGTDLKEVSFQNDGLGFSPNVLSNLANNGEREKRLKTLAGKAADLKNTPTSTVGITGLETCLKQIVGPASEIGAALSWVEKNATEKAGEIRSCLEQSLGLERLEITDSWLEEYIDRRWTELRKSDPKIKVKRLDNDSPAQKVCKKALTDRLRVIIDWLVIVESERNSKFEKFRDKYARVLNQLKTALQNLREVIKADSGQDCYSLAGRNVLGLTIDRMQTALDGYSPEDSGSFFADLWRTPELMLGETGENVIVSELYSVKGLEPWVFLLRAVAAAQEKPADILPQINDYQSKWYRNYGSEALLLSCTGEKPADRTAAIQSAERAVKQDIQEFQSSTRLDRAYGKIQEHRMETAFSVLELARQVYSSVHNYASFQIFLRQLKELMRREINDRAARYENRVRELEENADYAGAAILDMIHKALENRNFNSVDTYINRLQNGDRDLPASEKGLERQVDFLAQFQECEHAYYKECQKRRSDSLASWGENTLTSMGKEYQHWTVPNEKKKGCTWLGNWIQGKNSLHNPGRIQNLLTGLGFRVKRVTRGTRSKPSSMYELFEVEVEKTSKRLKDYSHPVYTFGTDLSDPMYVVCLYGCKGASTLINTMTGDLQLSGSTIVLMDGSLSVADRHLIAEKFKADTSGQSPFLLIDRVLSLYLASLDEGNRKNAMLRCTLPYTFEVLYGNGSGAVPEEMFIGRVSEMNDLRSNQGPNLVYGGRQLGKTALLNRASKTLNDPSNGAYSFCVDVKDEGSAVLLDKVNRQLRKLNLLDSPCDSLRQLCETLQGAYEDRKFNQLRIFVDEVDHLFEEFQQNKYEALRPFIVMRDATDHHVKFVFAGTHNVAATESAEKDNNNLLHMGRPLCIEPLSTDDATKLIRIPMSYLGFEIGDPQIELILSNTNSYPGLIHMFCNALIQSVCRDYGLYYSNGQERENPPYRISDEQMRAVFKEKDIRKEIGIRVMSTIRLNQKYRVVSYLLAQMVYEDQENGRNRLYGYSAKELLDYNRREFHIPLLLTMVEQNLIALLDEMVRMGILWANNDTHQFRFRQQDFLSYIGSSEQVIEALLAESAEGQE